MGRTKTSFKEGVQLTDESLEQEHDVLELRRSGTTFREIAEQLRLSGPGQASKIFQRAMRRHTADIGPEVRDLEFLRLDELQSAVWEEAMDGNLKAVETVLKVMERRARMGGFDHTDKMAMAQLKIESDKIRLLAMALGKALDTLPMLTEEQKDQTVQVVWTELKELTA